MNYFEAEICIKLKKDYKKVDRAVINFMLKTLVPLGYSYICNSKLIEGIVCISKNVEKGILKDKFVEEVNRVLSESEHVAGFSILSVSLHPIEYAEMKYHCPVKYVNKSISL